MEPYDLILEDLQDKTGKTQQHLRDQLGTIRTGGSPLPHHHRHPTPPHHRRHCCGGIGGGRGQR